MIALVDLTLGYAQDPGFEATRRPSVTAQATRPPRVVEAVLDESAHALTALTLLKATGVAGAALALPVLAGAVLIDVDHVPMEFGVDVVTRGTNRPYSHSLVLIVALLGLAGLAGRRWRPPLLAVAFGVGTHLLRDMATGGVPLYWPFLARRETIGYGTYAVIMLIGGSLAAWSGRRWM